MKFLPILQLIICFRYATCLEGALKIKEISYMHSEGTHFPFTFFLFIHCPF